MFTEIFIKSLVNFLYLTLHKQPVTKARIKKKFNFIFNNLDNRIKEV